MSFIFSVLQDAIFLSSLWKYKELEPITKVAWLKLENVQVSNNIAWFLGSALSSFKRLIRGYKISLHYANVVLPPDLQGSCRSGGETTFNTESNAPINVMPEYHRYGLEVGESRDW